MPTSARTVLILGGTREAATIARALVDKHGTMRVISSLAGRTQAPGSLAGEVRVGGFGGAEGLASYLREQSVDLLIDATHPFATGISSNARSAAECATVRCLSFTRPPWRRVDGDRWTVVPTLEAASSALPKGINVFLALGRQHLDVFAVRTDASFVVRMVDPPASTPPLANCEVVLGKPGTVEDEISLFRTRAVDLLVCRNAGGDASYAKIEAARSLDLPVVMIDRPTAAREDDFTSVRSLLEAVDCLTP